MTEENNFDVKKIGADTEISRRQILEFRKLVDAIISGEFKTMEETSEKALECLVKVKQIKEESC